MKYDPATHNARLEIARQRLLYGPGLSADELVEFEQQKAREMAKAEARRNPSPQLELPEA